MSLLIVLGWLHEAFGRWYDFAVVGGDHIEGRLFAGLPAGLIATRSDADDLFSWSRSERDTARRRILDNIRGL